MVDYEALYDLCHVLNIEWPTYAKLNELIGQAGSKSALTISNR
jgi:hypothetical protein